MLTFPKPFDSRELYKVGMKEAASVPVDSIEEYEVLSSEVSPTRFLEIKTLKRELTPSQVHSRSQDG
jgi:hypothetical protein